MSNNFAPGFIVGYAAGSASQKEEDEAKQRRLSQKGKDQQLFLINDTIDNIGEKIAKVWDNYIYKRQDKKLYEVKSTFRIGNFIGSIIITAIIAALVAFFAHDPEASYYPSKSNTLLYTLCIIIPILISIIIGFGTGGEQEIENIKIKDKGKNTIVCIKVYDSDGYRIYDEDELFDIATSLGLNPILK